MHHVIALLQKPDRKRDWQSLLGHLVHRLRAKTEVFPVWALFPASCGDKILAEAFEKVGEKLGEPVDKGASVTVLVDRVDLERLQPLAPASWEALIARLVLAWPEVRWLFSQVCHEKDPDFGRRFGVASVFTHPGLNPVFDGEGLRDRLRQTAAGDNTSRNDAKHLARRTQHAIALDEEEAYSHFNAYVAYRQGFRAVPVSTRALADHLLKTCKDESLALAFEDLFLNFPDTPGAVELKGLSELSEARHQAFPRLEHRELRERIFVSSGQRLAGDGAKWARNRAYLARQRAQGKHLRILYKPLSGMFDLWRRSGLQRRLRNGLAEGFVWPPKWPPIMENPHGHSCPGVLLVIASSLIERAERLLPQVRSVQDTVRGAVLATDALELLGGKTPTTSIEALDLKHQFEVLAECEFSGVEYHIAIRPRLGELRRDVEAICRWFHPRQKRLAAYNAEMHILTHLVKILRDHGQFDEEQICMNRVRYLHNTLWMRQLPVRYLLWPLIRYIEWLLSSFFRFCLTLVGIVLVFSVFYTYSGGHPQWIYGIEDAVSSFFSMGAPIHHEGGVGQDEYSFAYVAVICTAIVAGCIHIGVFISHLYSMMSRK